MKRYESGKKLWSYPTSNLEETGRRISFLREREGYTVKEVAEILGFSSAQAVYNWQKGKSLPTMDNALILARLFHVSIEDILVTNETPVYVSDKVRYLFVS